MEGRPSECESGRGRSMGRLRYLYGRKALRVVGVEAWESEIPIWKEGPCESSRGRSMGRLRYLYLTRRPECSI